MQAVLESINPTTEAGQMARNKTMQKPKTKNTRRRVACKAGVQGLPKR